MTMLVSREPFKIKLSFENRDRHGAGDVCDGIVNATVVSSIRVNDLFFSLWLQDKRGVEFRYPKCSVKKIDGAFRLERLYTMFRLLSLPICFPHTA